MGVRAELVDALEALDEAEKFVQMVEADMRLSPRAYVNVVPQVRESADRIRSTRLRIASVLATHTPRPDGRRSERDE